MSQRKYWKGMEERERTPDFIRTVDQEFSEPLSMAPVIDSPEGVSRRSFLKAAGFTMATAALTACTREPVEKAIPLLVQDETAIPGKSYWYASTCGGCQAGCGILTKNRDGRPVKIEGNPQHPLSRGGLCAVGQAMLLGVYDSRRLKQPIANGAPVDWPSMDVTIMEQLGRIRSGVYVLTGTVTSPSTRDTIRRFLAQYTDSAHIEYDAVSYSAILDAHEITHGRRLLPHYRFDAAEVITAVDADFLGTWLSPVEFTRDYIAGRTLEGQEPRLSRHIQIEGRLSLTGSNADRRIRMAPHQYGAALGEIARRLAARAFVTLPQLSAYADAGIDRTALGEVADQLWAARSKSLVVCGLNDTGVQCVVNAINHLLGNYGATVDVDHPSHQQRGSDRAMAALVDAMNAGRVNALFMADTNPVYSLPDGQAFAEALDRIPLTVAFAGHPDETTTRTKFVCPASHPLECWDDAEPVDGVVSVSQPTLTPLAPTRTLRHCLNAWMGGTQGDRHIIETYWQNDLYARRSSDAPFQLFRDRAVHDGYALLAPAAVSGAAFNPAAAWPASGISAPEPGELALALYENIGMRDGRHAHNAWLHELPDPVTKTVWDNYVSVAPKTAEKLKLAEGDVASVQSGNTTLELPVLIQPGQHEQVVAIAVGYGRAGTDRFAHVGPEWIRAQATVAESGTVGGNAFRLATSGRSGAVTVVTLKSAGRHVDLARTQTHHTITVPEHLGGQQRDLVRETTLAAYRLDPAAGNPETPEPPQLWVDDYPYTGHHWGMTIDLNRCTGCSACIIACQSENNIPVVGRDEVFRRREMHWIRLDRYYAGTDEEVDVLHQPVMCQHCGNAACEAVCPVLATVHSDEGLNQQVYNRCVGTRYCANNCAYKVRRFNWFDYWKPGEQEHLALNPDLTTRTRGVMEKCSLCVQRIQEAKAEAKRNGKPLDDRDIQTACQQSCPAQAIVFGDMNRPDSPVARLIDSPRHYRMLEEMNFRPSVGYLVRVRHRV